MYCKYGSTSCRFPGRFSYKGWSWWSGEVKKATLGFGLQVVSDDWRVYLCFRYLYITSILWNYIQSRLVSILLFRHNYTLIVGKVGCLVFTEALLVVFLVGSFIKVYLDGAVKKKGWLQVLDLKRCFEGLFVFHFPVHFIYILELYIS